MRRSLQTLRRHKVFVAASTVLGLAAGLAFAVLRPPLLTSNAIVALPPSVHDVSTQVVIATSNPVLADALRTIDSGESPSTLRSAIQVKDVTTNLILVSALGRTAAQTERTADAVATSYVAYVNSPHRPGPKMQARILTSAEVASGPSEAKRWVTYGGLGTLAGLLIGSIVLLAASERLGN